MLIRIKKHIKDFKTLLGVFLLYYYYNIQEDFYFPRPILGSVQELILLNIYKYEL